MRNVKDCSEEVSSKSALKQIVDKEWCRDGEVFKVCTGSGSCKAAVQTEDRLSWVEDKKTCKMIIDERCVMCESDAEEDVEHLLVMCGEFEWDRWVWRMR